MHVFRFREKVASLENRVRFTLETLRISAYSTNQADIGLSAQCRARLRSSSFMRVGNGNNVVTNMT